MERDPVLRTTTWAEGRVKYRMIVNGGLHYIRGNHAPYFSLTMSSWRNGREDGGGASHDIILSHFQELSDLAALHLSDINGVPMHAEANGWYNLAGALGGAGERFHVGNSDRHFPITPPEDKPWQTTEYRKPTESECLQIFAEHCRIPLAEATTIWADVASKWNYPDMRARWKDICESMKPRWKAEAEACIAKHGLKVYGDKWTEAA